MRNEAGSAPEREVDRAGSTSATCWDVIQRAAAGDAGARATFGSQYLPLIRTTLAQRWANGPHAADVDDATQEVFVECLRAKGPLTRVDPAHGDFRGFLFGIVRNVALRLEERWRKAGAGSQALSQLCSNEDQLSRVFDREWARMVMRDAGDLMRTRAEVSGAGARMRVELLRLRFAEDLPLRAIAAQWELDPDAVHRAYAKAREEFKACLREVVGGRGVPTEEGVEAECRQILEMLG